MADTKRTQPGWMTFEVPGKKKPEEPNQDKYRAGFDKLVAEKKKLFEEQAAIRDQLTEMFEGVAKMNEEDKKQLAALREELKKIQDERKEQRDQRDQKQTALSSLRNQRNALQDQLRDLTADIGVFRDLDEIEEVIHHLQYRMETGSSSLTKEKQAIRRLAQLEDAKSLILKIQPMTEKLEALDDQHAVMEGEVNDIMSKIRNITEKHNAQYDELNSKRSSATPAKDPKFEEKVTKLKADRTAISKKIDEKNTEIDAFRDEQNAKRDAWQEWKKLAQEGFRKQIEEERAARQAEWEKRQDEKKQQERRAKKAKKMNPKAAEIDACDTLITFVKQKAEAAKRDEAERERKKKLASFDPAALVPEGMAIGKFDDDDGGLKPKKKQKQSAPKAKAASSAAGAPTKSEKIHINETNKKLFNKVEVKIPETVADLEKAKTELEAALTKFEAMKKSLDECSSDDEAPAPAAEETAAAAEEAA